MGRCLKGKDETRPVPGTYRCEKCGAVAREKGHACKPKKIKEENDAETVAPQGTTTRGGGMFE